MSKHLLPNSRGGQTLVELDRMTVAPTEETLAQMVLDFVAEGAPANRISDLRRAAQTVIAAAMTKADPPLGYDEFNGFPPGKAMQK